VLLKNALGRGHKDGTPTTRPSDFPEEDLNEAVERRTLARVIGEQFGVS
jgi:hypothetical protein